MVSNEKDYFTIEIPSRYGFGAGTFIFSKEMVQFRGKVFPINEIQGVSYSSLHYSQMLIPTSQLYRFSLRTKSERIKITMETALKIGDKHLQEVFQTLIFLTKHLIEPVILSKMLYRIFVEEKTVEFPGVRVNNKGFMVRSYFTKWDDEIKIPIYFFGDVVTFKRDKKGNYRMDHHISLREENVCLIPSLVEACAKFVREPIPDYEEEFSNVVQERSTAPYEILGISPGASWAEVENAYHIQAKQNHPDRVVGLAPEFLQLAENRMKMINSAYEDLKIRYSRR